MESSNIPPLDPFSNLEVKTLDKPKLEQSENVSAKKVQSAYVCGCNYHFGISQTSNNKDKYGIPIVYPPIPIEFGAPTILSYSTYYNKTVIVTIDGSVYGIGENDKSQISNSIPNQVNDDFRLIPLTYEVFSAVCGVSYTLYLLKTASDNNYFELAISYPNSISNQPDLIKFSFLKPIAIYGGDTDSAAITEEGSIIYIYGPTISKYIESSVFPVFLPGDDTASSIAWSKETVYALATSGHLYQSERKQMPTFTDVFELEGIEIVWISGVQDHCIAVSKDERVFVIGNNSDGQLGLGTEVKYTRKFMEVTSLRGLHIKKAYAGSYHSLFQTVNGQLFACGYDNYGQLLLNNKPKDNSEIGKNFYEPVKTSVPYAEFCIAGGGSTVVFADYFPPNSPNAYTEIKIKKNEKV